MTLTDLLSVQRGLARRYARDRALNAHGVYQDGERSYLSMGCVKDDDADITWDSAAMEKGYPWMAPTVADWSGAMGRRIDTLILSAVRDERIDL